MPKYGPYDKNDDHTYALYRSTGPNDLVPDFLPELGFLAVPGRPDLLFPVLPGPALTGGAPPAQFFAIFRKILCKFGLHFLE